MKALEWSQRFPNYQSIGDFFKRSGAANYSVPGLILPNCEPIQHFIAVLVTFKNEKDPIKNKGTGVVTRLFINF